MEGEGTVKIYDCPSYLSTLKDGLHCTRDEFCDATLLVGDEIFKAHKVILASNSKYFYSVFVQNFKERGLEEIRVPSEISPDAMQTLLNYFYSGKLILSQQNIESVCKATDYMRLDTLLEFCIEYMQETQGPSNYIRRYIIAETIQYFSPRLDTFKKTTSALIVKDAEVLATADFLNLTVDMISKILILNCQPEKAEHLYMLIVKWVSYDEENRREFLYDLMQMLPVSGLSSEFYDTKMKNEELLRRDSKCVLWLLDSSKLQNPTFLGSWQQPGLLFLGDRYTIRNCFLLNITNPKPEEISNRPKMSHFSVVSYKRRILLLGASGTETSYILDDPEKAWVECDWDLKFGRYNAGCVVLGDELFVFGGRDCATSLQLKGVLKFNFNLNQKQYLPTMKEPRSLPGAAVYENSIYVACGYGASPSIERFDPREGQWCIVGRYETDIQGCCSATHADYLYCSDESSGIVERFDFRANRSQKICSLPSVSGRSNWISEVEGDLYGANGKRIFKYEVTDDEWYNFCSKLDLDSPIIVPWI